MQHNGSVQFVNLYDFYNSKSYLSGHATPIHHFSLRERRYTPKILIDQLRNIVGRKRCAQKKKRLNEANAKHTPYSTSFAIQRERKEQYNKTRNTQKSPTQPINNTKVKILRPYHNKDNKKWALLLCRLRLSQEELSFHRRPIPPFTHLQLGKTPPFFSS